MEKLDQPTVSWEEEERARQLEQDECYDMDRASAEAQCELFYFPEDQLGDCIIQTPMTQPEIFERTRKRQVSQKIKTLMRIYNDTSEEQEQEVAHPKLSTKPVADRSQHSSGDKEVNSLNDKPSRKVLRTHTTFQKNKAASKAGSQHNSKKSIFLEDQYFSGGKSSKQEEDDDNGDEDEDDEEEESTRQLKVKQKRHDKKSTPKSKFNAKSTPMLKLRDQVISDGEDECQDPIIDPLAKEEVQ